VIGVALDALRVAEEGVTEQFASAGAPPHVRLTDPVNPLAGATVRLYVAVWPGVTVDDVEDPEAAAKVKSSPVPDSGIDSGLSAALSVSVSVPACWPDTVGVKLSEIEHELLTATAALQMLVWEKGPVILMLLI